jgi:hypothetical protein
MIKTTFFHGGHWEGGSHKDSQTGQAGPGKLLSSRDMDSVSQWFPRPQSATVMPGWDGDPSVLLLC